MGQDHSDDAAFDESADQDLSHRTNRRRDRRLTSEQHAQPQPFQNLSRTSPRQERDQPVDRVPEMLRQRREFGHTPLVAKLTNVTLDESTFGVLVRIDEILRWRSKLTDKEILDRIEEVYVSRFREALS